MTEPYKQKIEKTHVALVHETVAESLWRDAGTVAVFLVLWSVGYFADSIVLQAVGVVFAAMFTMARGMLLLKKNVDDRMTPDQARAWLDRKFPQDGAEGGNPLADMEVDHG